MSDSLPTTPLRLVNLTIDGEEITVPRGSTIWEAAHHAGIEIPVLCHTRRFNPVGVCRICVVDVGERVLAASCVREVAPDMEVQTRTESVERHRRLLTELLLADHPVPCEREQTTGDCELEALGRRYGLLRSNGDAAAVGRPEEGRAPLPAGQGRPGDDSSPVIAVDHQACILCDRCIRACDDVQSNEVMGRTGKGYGTRIAFDLDAPMGTSTCVSCGECVAACPTGALVNKRLSGEIRPADALTAVPSVCAYCGVGCAVMYYADGKQNRIAYVEGRESRVNDARLCVKGRYGFDYATHPQRLTRPLIRKTSAYPKGPLSGDVRGEGRGAAPTGGKGKRKRRPGGLVDYDEVLPHFREATWDEALELVARRLKGIRDEHGSSFLAGFGSAKCSNEEAYLFQKLVRAVFGTNNVDHCTRLCHASSVAALMETIGSGAVTNVFTDVGNSDVALVTGSNTTHNHPVAATFFKEAAKNGTKLIIVDPRRPGLADHAHRYVQIRPGTDVAFYNGVMSVIVEEGLFDDTFVARRTEGFLELKRLLADYPPEKVAPVCGVEPEVIRTVAQEIGRARAMMIFWGMGIAQHTHGTDNARCLISLCLLTGNIGRPGTGLHPLRGQNNVQGASDAGLIPIVYPGYQNVGDPAVREKFQQAWGVPLDPNPGLTVVEIVHGALKGTIKGMYMMGENPFISDPNTNKVRKALAALDFLVVQDIFLTETAEFADVILPASSIMEKTGTYTNTDRRVQIGRPVLDSPGEARVDWQITQEIGRRMGYAMDYNRVEEIFDEMCRLAPGYNGLSYEGLGEGGKLWPCPNPESDGVQILFGDTFPTGRGRLVPVEFQHAKELPDDEYPFVLNTGRLLEHWHTGSMTRRSKALDAIEPGPFVEVHPEDARALGIVDGELVKVASRRGEIVLAARVVTRTQRGSVFVPFHFREAAANVLTIDELDPYGKIPEYKFCAVKVESAS